MPYAQKSRFAEGSYVTFNYGDLRTPFEGGLNVWQPFVLKITK